LTFLGRRRSTALAALALGSILLSACSTADDDGAVPVQIVNDLNVPVTVNACSNQSCTTVSDTPIGGTLGARKTIGVNASQAGLASFFIVKPTHGQWRHCFELNLPVGATKAQSVRLSTAGSCPVT
jgi:hypothetical protein